MRSEVRAARFQMQIIKRIEVRGDSEGGFNEKEVDSWRAGLTEDETQALAGKQKCLRHEASFPEEMHSVPEDLFQLVETPRWHLKRDGHPDV